MSRWQIVAVLSVATVWPIASVDAQVRFPRVYGSTGRPYGPTQAHYQYERQYGRPWHGYGGYSVSGYAPASASFYSGAPYWNGYGWPNVIAPPVIVAPFAPGLSFYSPGVYGGYTYYGTPGYYAPYPDHSLVQPGLSTPLDDAWRENQERWGAALPPAKPDPVTLPVVPSTPEAQLKSLRAQQAGDEQLRRQQWTQAYVEYKNAVQAAPDRAEAHFRLGLALAATQHFESAAFSMKRAFALDPQMAQTGANLETIFGPGSQIARSSVVHKVADHVAADIRDPDRLFLFGVLLHFSGDTRSSEVFEAGYRLAGKGQHFLAFLQPGTKVATPPASAPATGPTLPPAPLPSPPAPNGAPVVLPPPA